MKCYHKYVRQTEQWKFVIMFNLIADLSNSIAELITYSMSDEYVKNFTKIVRYRLNN